MNLQLGRFFDILAAIVGVAIATVLVTGKNTVPALTAFFNGFSNSLRAAEGN